MQTIEDVMTPDPLTLPSEASASAAAALMRDADIGDVIIVENGSLRGIVTDRDIVIRAIAEGRLPGATPVGEICSREVVCVAPHEPADRAVQLMREKAIRRLPVVDDGRLVGVVSIGDLAVARQPDSALADISDAPPNN